MLGKSRDEILRYWGVDPALVTPEIEERVLVAHPWLREADQLQQLNTPPVLSAQPDQVAA
jgi:hypothetical protein